MTGTVYLIGDGEADPGAIAAKLVRCVWVLAFKPSIVVGNGEGGRDGHHFCKPDSGHTIAHTIAVRREVLRVDEQQRQSHEEKSGESEREGDLTESISFLWFQQRGPSES